MIWGKKGNEVQIHDTTLINLENTVRTKKPVTKDHILHDSIYMKWSEQANPYKQK